MNRKHLFPENAGYFEVPKEQWHVHELSEEEIAALVPLVKPGGDLVIPRGVGIDLGDDTGAAE